MNGLERIEMPSLDVTWLSWRPGGLGSLRAASRGIRLFGEGGNQFDTDRRMREAVDFCRTTPKGRESEEQTAWWNDQLISPWNSPLAILYGQVAALWLRATGTAGNRPTERAFALWRQFAPRAGVP